MNAKSTILSLLLTLWTLLAFSQDIKGPIQVHPNGRFLTTPEGAPFFWMADTAWELFHRLDIAEATYYLDKRKEQGFNVVQAVVLAELDGLNTPNAYGELPFSNLEKWEYNEAYFQHVDLILDLAEKSGIHIALLPTWGDKLFKHNWGVGPEIFDLETAYTYGKWIGARYQDRKNLVWVLGGDRNPRKESEDIEVWNQMAKGILESQNPENPILMTFHPQPADLGGSSNWFHQEEWLSFNMHQTGHCPDTGNFEKIAHDYTLSPTKPTIDGEPMYEEHPKCFDAKNQGYSEAADIRMIMYWNVFAGAAGQTYGCHAVWQMYDLDRAPVNAPLKPWNKSLDLEMANQVKHLKNLMLSRTYFSRIPDQSLIATNPERPMQHLAATRSTTGDFAMVYFPEGNPAQLNISSFPGKTVKSTWYDPRTGVSFAAENYTDEKFVDVSPPSQGRGNDWVLILDAMD
ncbi:glycoside hydrolase family 140 protein [Algoriphagus jejuensis]|uniref:Glycoside hydrolase family 140 protein n=1 Tax=Algoriphagus jejuensis TaxID=419934 RepID=A0ABP3YD50_9BACT